MTIEKATTAVIEGRTFETERELDMLMSGYKDIDSITFKDCQFRGIATFVFELEKTDITFEACTIIRSVLKVRRYHGSSKVALIDTRLESTALTIMERIDHPHTTVIVKGCHVFKSKLAFQRVSLANNEIKHSTIRMKAPDKKDLIAFVDRNSLWQNVYQTSKGSGHDFMSYSIDSYGTYAGSVTYFPLADRVVAGCWSGTLAEFERQSTVVIEMDTDQNLNVPHMDAVLVYFTSIRASLN